MSLMGTTLAIAFFTIGCVAAAPARAQGRLEEHGAGTRFVSEKYEFSIAVPRGWHASLERDTPIFINFTSVPVASQLTLPKGGASIVIVAQDTLPGQRRLGNTPSDWAVADARGISAGGPLIESLDMPKESEASEAVLSSYDVATFSPDDQPQRSVGVFWEFHGKLFAGHLTYVSRDPNGSSLKKLFVETIRSIRPVDRQQR